MERKKLAGRRMRQGVGMNIVLAVGLLLVLAGVFLLVAAVTQPEHLFALRPVCLLVGGAILLFIALAITQDGRQLFVGILGVLMGVITLLTDVRVIPFTLSELWPTIVISCGIALFPAGLYNLRRMRSVFLFPAIMLVLLGSSFLLFSLRVLPFSFTAFISRWWPVLVIVLGLALIALFFVQQLRRKDFPYLEDDSLVDGEED